MSRILTLLAVASVALVAAVVSADMHAGVIPHAKANANVSGALRMPVVFSANMVLQRAPQKARVWGWTTASTGVTVTIAGQTKNTVSDSAGAWLVELDAVNGGATTYTMGVKDASGNSVSFGNILFGDVFLCSGQSNMQFTVSMVNNSAAEIKDSVNYPNLRVFSVAQKASLTPLYDVTSKAPYQWGVSSPAVIGGPDWQYFSATCYFFGRDLYKALNVGGAVVPIGLVDSDWGGTYIQAWSSPDANGQCNSTSAVIDAIEALDKDMLLDTQLLPELMQQMTEADGELDVVTLPIDARNADPSQFVTRAPAAVNDPSPNTPSVLWNGMIVPLLNMRFAGAAWYQGEANSYAPIPYACQFPAMIRDWRSKFALPLPFFFVQLAPFLDDRSFPALRWAQTSALALTATGMAVAMDLGDPGSPEGSIHPRYKQEVGARLAAGALDTVYGQNVPQFGPSLGPWSFYESNGVATFQVTFGNAQKLHNEGTVNCELCCDAPTWQWLNNQTQVWTPIAPQYVSVSGLTVTVNAWTNGADVGGLNYAWYSYPECAIYNENRLPAPEIFISTN